MTQLLVELGPGVTGLWKVHWDGNLSVKNRSGTQVSASQHLTRPPLAA